MLFASLEAIANMTSLPDCCNTFAGFSLVQQYQIAYIHIYIYIERERERERESKLESCRTVLRLFDAISMLSHTLRYRLRLGIKGPSHLSKKMEFPNRRPTYLKGCYCRTIHVWRFVPFLLDHPRSLSYCTPSGTSFRWITVINSSHSVMCRA